MAVRAKNLLAGTIAATATFVAAATSHAQETVVLNDQVQLGDVFAEQTLDVVEVEEQTTLVTTAAGNTLSGAVEGGSLSLTSSQSMQGDATAATSLTAAGSAGSPVTILSEAVGNTADAGAYGADMDAAVTQTVGATEVRAAAYVDAPLGRMPAGGSVAATAIANSTAFGVSDGSTSTTAVTQSSAALTQADVEAVVQYIPDGAVFSAAATSNNVSSAGTNGTTQTITVEQEMTGPRTQASTYVASGNAWEIQGSTAAVSNNVALTNEHGALEVVVDQSNGGLVYTDAVVEAYDFGLGSAQAYGVGNSVLAGNAGQYVNIDSTQLNSGGVEASAVFNGNDGYDAYSNSVAMGNAITGYACSECQGQLIANSTQINTGGVSSTSSVTITGSARSIVGTATAVGNNASFWVTSPGG